MRPIWLCCATLLLTQAPLPAQIRTHPAGEKISHDRFIRVVREADSPVERVWIRSRDGLSIPAAIRRPKGRGPFPALVYFHGAPGGRGMEKLVSWSLGATGGPLWERFLQEGYAVIVADYRNNASVLDDAAPKDRITYADDGVSVIDYVRALSYIDGKRIAVYGVSRGGNLALHVASRADVRAVVLGAAAPNGWLLNRGENVRPVAAPILILIGTADALFPMNRALYDVLAGAGKTVRMEIHENGYHDFVAGPQGHEGRDEPLLTSTLDALETAVTFLRDALK